MTDETKELLQIHLEFINKVLKENGAIMAICADKTDFDKSKVLFIDREPYLTDGKIIGISISLTDFNKNLI